MSDASDLDRLINERLEALLPKKLEELRQKQTPSMTLIATKGTLDFAYPPFILASTAAALGWNVSIFFTFYGLTLLRKDLDHLKISPLGNPGMPMKMPFGPEWFKSINWNIPNAVQAVVPGFESLATTLMKKTMHDKGVAGVAELRQACIEGGVELIGCQMTVDLFGFKPEDFIVDVKEYCGAATFLPRARDADVSLFI
jgi:peroxiredoxin family protein